MGELTYKRGYTTDESFEALIEQELDRSEQPTFLFAITMQNHQPFSALPEEEITLNVSSDCLSQENLDAVTTYSPGAPGCRPDAGPSGRLCGQPGTAHSAHLFWRPQAHPGGQLRCLC